jgi:hypothetical protein
VTPPRACHTSTPPFPSPKVHFPPPPPWVPNIMQVQAAARARSPLSGPPEHLPGDSRRPPGSDTACPPLPALRIGISFSFAEGRRGFGWGRQRAAPRPTVGAARGRVGCCAERPVHRLDDRDRRVGRVAHLPPPRAPGQAGVPSIVALHHLAGLGDVGDQAGQELKRVHGGGAGGGPLGLVTVRTFVREVKGSINRLT